MNILRRMFLTAAACGAAAILYGCAPTQKSQDPFESVEVARLLLSTEIGSRKVGEMSYSVKASAPLSSPATSQRLQLLSHGVTPPYGALTRIFNIRTGTKNTVAGTCARIDRILRNFLDETHTPNAVIGEVGDFSHGDGVQFVAVSKDEFRYDTAIPARRKPESITLQRTDIQAFAGILEDALKGAH